MTKPKVLLAFNEEVRQSYVDDEQLRRLESFATWDWFECDGGGILRANQDAKTKADLVARIGAYEGVIVCHGAPKFDDSVLASAPKLRIIGELEGDRFAARIDVDAAWARDIRTVDTTNASSYPVAEWALGLILISLRNIGTQFRRVIAGQPRSRDLAPYGGILQGRRVGLIGCGNPSAFLDAFAHSAGDARVPRACLVVVPPVPDLDAPLRR